MRNYEDIIKKIVFILFLILYINGISQVALRYLFGFSFRWTIEISRYIMMYVVFICLGPTHKRGLLIGVSALEDRLPLNYRNYLSIFRLVIMIIFASLMIKVSIDIILLQLNMMQLSPALQVSMGLIYLAIPVGFSLYIVYMVLEILQKLNIIH